MYHNHYSILFSLSVFIPRSSFCSTLPHPPFLLFPLLYPYSSLSPLADVEMVKKNTMDICQVTHADPRCAASCIAVTTAVSHLLHSNPMKQHAWVLACQLRHSTCACTHAIQPHSYQGRTLLEFLFVQAGLNVNSSFGVLCFVERPVLLYPRLH